MSTLYDDLLEEVNNQDPETQIDISRVCYTINNIYKHLPKNDAEYHYKMIGSLIIHHKFINNKTDTAMIPYNCKIIDENNIKTIPYNCQIMAGNLGLLPSMNDLPVLLQKIISQYVITFSIK
jgi:hypothetical protein